jgi:hypothetical protein
VSEESVGLSQSPFAMSDIQQDRFINGNISCFIDRGD